MSITTLNVEKESVCLQGNLFQKSSRGGWMPHIFYDADYQYTIFVLMEIAFPYPATLWLHACSTAIYTYIYIYIFVHMHIYAHISICMKMWKRRTATATRSLFLGFLNMHFLEPVFWKTRSVFEHMNDCNWMFETFSWYLLRRQDGGNTKQIQKSDSMAAMDEDVRNLCSKSLVMVFSFFVNQVKFVPE